MTLVIDASVIIKWLLRDPEREADTDRATALLESVVTGRVEILQPFHWLAEVAAVLCRLTPDTAEDDILRLRALRLPGTDEPAVIRRACELSIRHGTHVFDSLYHAVALDEPDGLLITADHAYGRAAAGIGRLIALEAWKG